MASEITARYNVCDISRIQGDVDFAKVKAAGYWGVILKAGVTGYGANHSMSEDVKFARNYAAAKKAGLHVGAYYYSGAMSEEFAVKEAKYFLSLLKGKQFDLPVYGDFEETHSPTNMPSLGKKKLTAVVKKWCETVENAGYFVGVYTSKSWARDYLDMSVLNRFTFWLAHWVPKTDYSGPYAMWQYSNTGSIPGIAGRVDLDYCYRPFPTIIKNAGLNGYKDKTYSIRLSKLTEAQKDKAVTALKGAGFNPVVAEE